VARSELVVGNPTIHSGGAPLRGAPASCSRRASATAAWDWCSNTQCRRLSCRRCASAALPSRRSTTGGPRQGPPFQALDFQLAARFLR